MVFSLLLIGGYAAAKTGKALTNKKEWDMLVADYELERDFEKVLKLCGKGESNVNWTNQTPEINKTVINNCVTNLKTIPYLTEKDITKFKIKAWSTKLQQIQEEKEQKYKIVQKELEKITKQIKNKPTHRITLNIFKRNLYTVEYSQILYKMCKNTIWGELIYNPKFKEWLKNNDLETIDEQKEQKLINSNQRINNHWLNMPMPCGHTKDHEVWVVNEPIGYDANEIYWKCREYTETKMIKTKEEKDAIYHKTACEDLL